MPEQNEWSNGTYNPDYGKRQYVDSGDYAWTTTLPPKPVADCRTYSERIDQRIAILETEVQHLREDIARMKTGESGL